MPGGLAGLLFVIKLGFVDAFVVTLRMLVPLVPGLLACLRFVIKFVFLDAFVVAD
jgi:hypothetical protein